MPIAYLLLGSNQGHRENYLAAAIKSLENSIGLVTQQSALYETAAWGLEEQASFLNQVLQISTGLNPEALLIQINIIEKELGRVRKVKWGARVIDIDILYYNDLILQTDKLIIPHPQLQNRRFTLVPLVEVAPNYQHPLLLKTNQQLLAACPDDLPVTIFTTTGS